MASTNYALVWRDEFNDAGKPDSTKWGYEYGFIRNREKQYYTNDTENARVEDGFLIIKTQKESVENEVFAEGSNRWQKQQKMASYTSASLTTKDRAELTYGKIIVRAKLPKGVGLWPAIWMLGTSWKVVGWPQTGEIDIMEHVGFEPDSIFGTVHTQAYNHTKGTQQ